MHARSRLRARLGTKVFAKSWIAGSRFTRGTSKRELIRVPSLRQRGDSKDDVDDGGGCARARRRREMDNC